MSFESFLRELRSLLRAPYALIHLETFEEDRAVHLLRALAQKDQRPVYEWSPVSGFGGEQVHRKGASFFDALDLVERTQEPAIFIVKDIAEHLQDSIVRRRLREIEAPLAAFGKTVIFVGPDRIEAAELEKDLTRVTLPLPDRKVLGRELLSVFPKEHYAQLDRQSLVNGATGLTVKEAHRAFHRVRQDYDQALRAKAPFDLEKAILLEKQRLIGQHDALEFHPLSEGLGDVGGLEELKRWLKERKAAFGEEARAFGLPAPKGLLLLGVQGCGKSLTAKVIGRHWGLPLLRLELGAIFDGRRSAEEALRHALQTCEAMAPCVLWMDELEKGFSSNDEGRSSRVLGSLLTWLQEKVTPVFLVATANSVQDLPPELLRKGRFDEIFFIDLPEAHERRDILQIHLQRRGRQFEADLVTEIAERCEHFSGSELEQVVISALYVAFAQKREMNEDDLRYAVQEVVPLYRTYEEQIKALREWADGRARPASLKRRVLDYFR